MQQSARLAAHAPAESWREYHLEAELLHEFRRHGRSRRSTRSIVAAGANACVLHYPAGDAPARRASCA
jgi:Xaa-Pro aminopeptidase